MNICNKAVDICACRTYLDGVPCCDSVAKATHCEKQDAEPRFLLDKESICFGCELYRHWTESDDPFSFDDSDIDEHGGVCDTTNPCFCGNLNTYRRIKI